MPPGGPGDMIEFSNIWISNSPDGTVSKIDTIDAVEVGRYQVTPSPVGSVLVGPSRTSVSIAGDMVVADRSGGLAKVYAELDNCVDLNGNGSIETSSGPNALPYGDDECMAWRIEIPRRAGVHEDRRGPRAVQWTAPEILDGCGIGDDRVWVGFCNEADDDATVWLVNGVDGNVEVEIPIPGFQCEMMGPYGGGVDPDNNFWFVDRDTRKALYKIDYNCTPGAGSPCWTRFDRPDPDMDPYGITADFDGVIWMAGENNSLYSYDSRDGTWANYKPDLDAFFAQEVSSRAGDGNAEMLRNNILRGLMMDDDRVLWIATVQGFGGGPFPGLLKVDTKTSPPTFTFYSKETLGNELQHAAGISIDVEGFVWLVDTFSNGAYKIDPASPASFTRVGGLNQPYTYSDMTGFGLNRIVFPPTG